MMKQDKPQKEENLSSDDSNEIHRKRVLEALKLEMLQEIKPLTLGVLAMLLSSLSNQSVPILLGKLLDHGKNSNNKNNNGMLSVHATLMLVALGGGMASLLRTAMMVRVQDSISMRMRSQAFASLLMRSDLDESLVNNEEKETKQQDNNTTAQSMLRSGHAEEEKKEETLPAEETAAITATTTTTLENPDDANKTLTPAAVGKILTDDVNTATHSLTSTVANLFRSTSSVCFATYRMLTINPLLLGVSFTVVPLIGATALGLRKWVSAMTERQRQLGTQAASFAQERLMHLSMVKMSHREHDEVEHYRALQAEHAQLGQQVSLANGMFMGFVFWASTNALCLVFGMGGRAVAKQKMTAGQLQSFAMYTFMLGLGTSGVFKAIGEIKQGFLSAERVYRLIYYKPEGEEKEQPTATTDNATHADLVSDNAEYQNNDVALDDIRSISMQNVHFAYSSKPERWILNDFTLKLERGKVVALVGRNGAGKTTVASLLAGLYKPRMGNIVLSTNANDDVLSYDGLSRDMRTKLVQVVPQHPTLFQTSILENVRYTNPTASIKEVWDALHMAHCEELVSNMEQGLEASVGLNGSRLSGGERQRLGLARALLAHPSILVLDEPASSLDAQGEMAVARAVQACREQDRALLLITHRAQALQLADTIAVVQNGHVIETGSYPELVKNRKSHLCQLMPDLR